MSSILALEQLERFALPRIPCVHPLDRHLVDDCVEGYDGKKRALAVVPRQERRIYEGRSKEGGPDIPMLAALFTVLEMTSMYAGYLRQLHVRCRRGERRCWSSHR